MHSLPMLVGLEPAEVGQPILHCSKRNVEQFGEFSQVIHFLSTDIKINSGFWHQEFCGEGVGIALICIVCGGLEITEIIPEAFA